MKLSIALVALATLASISPAAAQDRPARLTRVAMTNVAPARTACSAARHCMTDAQISAGLARFRPQDGSSAAVEEMGRRQLDFLISSAQ